MKSVKDAVSEKYLMASSYANPGTSYIKHSNFISTNFMDILHGDHKSMNIMAKGSVESSMCSGDIDD